MMFSSPMRPSSARKAKQQIEDNPDEGEVVREVRSVSTKPKRAVQTVEKSSTARARAFVVDRPEHVMLAEIQNNIFSLREELWESFHDEHVMRQEHLQSIQRELGDQWQNIKQEQILRSELLKSFKVELGEQLRETFKEEQQLRDQRVQSFQEELGIHIRALREDIGKAASQFRDTIDDTRAGSSQIVEALKANGKVIDTLSQVQGKCFKETIAPFSDELVLSFKQELAEQVDVIRQDISRTSSDFQALSSEIQNGRSRILDAMRDNSKLIDMLQSGQNNHYAKCVQEIQSSLACILEAAKEFQKLASSLQKIETNSISASVSVDQVRRDGVKSTEGLDELGPGWIDSIRHVWPLTRDVKHGFEGVSLQMADLSTRVDRILSGQQRLQDEALHKLWDVNRSPDCTRLLEVLRGEFSSLANLVEQAKTFVPPQVLAANSQLLAAMDNRNEKSDLSQILEALARMSGKPDLSPVLDVIRSECRSAAATVAEHGKIELCNIIRSESQNTAAALVEHSRAVFAHLPSTRRQDTNNMDFVRFEQLLDAIRTSLEAIQGQQVHISSNLGVVVKRCALGKASDDKNFRDASFEETLCPEPAPESPSSSRRLEMREPRVVAAVSSSRIADALTNISEDIAQHRSECRAVWESQDLSLEAVRQTMQALVKKRAEDKEEV
mmetsp:Transcript_54618/g.84935  ORF Transcript_54618/g.84935 Transcript_54618/m.84935 type:complete len:670 (-) Transcript_54618:135-2144(-)